MSDPKVTPEQRAYAMAEEWATLTLLDLQILDRVPVMFQKMARDLARSVAINAYMAGWREGRAK